MNSDVSIKIFDPTGKEIYVCSKTGQSQGFQSMKISNLNLTSGIYFLKVLTNKGIAVQKIIITNE